MCLMNPLCGSRRHRDASEAGASAPENQGSSAGGLLQVLKMEEFNPCGINTSVAREAFMKTNDLKPIQFRTSRNLHLNPFGIHTYLIEGWGPRPISRYLSVLQEVRP
jgi:hypothetical protein